MTVLSSLVLLAIGFVCGLFVRYRRDEMRDARRRSGALRR